MRYDGNAARWCGRLVRSSRAPWLNAEYLKNPDATCALWEGDWLYTGDVGHIDAVGTLMITDRMRMSSNRVGNGCPRLSWRV